MTLNPTNISIIKRLLVGRTSRPLRSILFRLAPQDLATLLGLLNDREIRLLISALMSIGKTSATLVELPEPQLASLLQKLEREIIISILKSAHEEDGAYILSVLDEVIQKDYLDLLEPPRKKKLQQYLNFPEASAGRIMHSQVFTIPVHITAGEGLDHIRKKAQEISIYYIYCTDDENRLVGVVSLRDLATAEPETPVEKIAKRDFISVDPTTPSEEVARIVSHYDYVAIPVIDKNKKLLGLITVDDVLDIIQDQATANIYASAGLQEDDRVYSPASQSIKNRLPWMLLNLGLASIASAVISLFEDTMSQVIILASLNNIVAGMAGNTAIQTLTVVTRGIATGDFSFISKAKAILKEAYVGVVVGFLTGLAAGILVFIWKGSLVVGVIIFISMTVNAIVAAAFGAGIPLLLKRMNLDPAVGSGVLVTMLTDIFGFFSFLGLAALSLKYFT